MKPKRLSQIEAVTTRLSQHCRASASNQDRPEDSSNSGAAWDAACVLSIQW